MRRVVITSPTWSGGVADLEVLVVELSDGESVGLHGVVDGVDVVVGGGRDRDVLAALVGAGPGGGDVVEVFGERRSDDPVVVCVCVEAGRVAVSQFEGRGCFPVVVEAVDGVEFDGAPGGAEFGEHATAADGVELVRVTDQGEPPVVLVGEQCEAVEIAGGEHPRLIDDHGGAGRQLPKRFGWPIGPGVFVQEFGDSVSRSCQCRFRGYGQLSRLVPTRTLGDRVGRGR